MRSRRGVGERSFHVAEQFAFENVLAQRRAIQRHKRLVLPRAVLVDGLGHQLLAGAGLALDQHAGVGRGDPLQQRDDIVHLGARADHPFEAELLVQPAVQFGIGAAQTLAVGRGLFDHGPQLLEVERLEQVVEGPLLHGQHGRLASCRGR